MIETATKPAVGWAELRAKVAELAQEYRVPGVAVGIYLDGDEQVATYGVTSIDNPLEVTEETLFQFGSTGKTFTASALMRLVEQGKVNLHAPVRQYVPELKLKDEDVAGTVTVLQLLNHTAGWQGDFFEDTGFGDDAVAKYVAKLVDLDQVSPLGTQASYNNAALVLAGRVIENVTGKSYEEAVKELLLDPLGLDHTLASMTEIMTHRFVVGHRKKDDGAIEIVRSWAMPRSMTAAGGWSASVRDQLAWVRFHLGDGKGKDGEQVLSRDTLDLMKESTFDMGASAIGDAVGISWLIKDIDGTRMVGHGGTTNGQLSAFQMVPARNFGVVVLTNSAPNGSQLHGAVVKWSLERYLGVVEPEVEPLQLSEKEMAQYIGDYRSISSILHLFAEDGTLKVKGEPTPQMLERLKERGDEAPPEQPPLVLAILPNDVYKVAEGPAKGMRGYFVRNEEGAVTGIHLGGRLATR